MLDQIDEPTDTTGLPPRPTEEELTAAVQINALDNAHTDFDCATVTEINKSHGIIQASIACAEHAQFMELMTPEARQRIQKIIEAGKAHGMIE